MSDTAVVQDARTARPTTELVEAIAAALDEPVWLRDDRLAALARYETTAWPTGSEEPWRRTPLADVPLERWAILLDGGALESGAAPAALHGLAPDDRAGLLTQVDAGVAARELADALTARGVIVAPLSEAAREHADLVRAHLHQTLPLQDHDAGSARFTALSAACWTQGLFVYVPKDAAIDAPLYHLLSKTTAGAGIFGHTLVVAERGSRVTLVEAAASDAGPTDASLVQRVVEVSAADGAEVNLIELNAWGPDVDQFLTVAGQLGAGARATVASAVFGSHLHRERNEWRIGADGSHLDLLAVFVGGDRQHIEHNTLQVHDAPGGSSRLVVKGALDDHAQAVQHGIITITPRGQRTVSDQTMRNLLLSEGAGAEPIPVLEIEADDVQCAHAAAVGPVDPEHLFYLQSRGIDPETAESMIVHGYLTEQIDQLPDAHARAVIEAMVERKLRR